MKLAEKERDLGPVIEELRNILASDEFEDERHRKAAIRRALHESAAGLDSDDIQAYLERLKARFPDRTHESLTLARELELQNAELQREVDLLRQEKEDMEARLGGIETLLDTLWATMVRAGQPAGGVGIAGGSSAAAPRSPEAMKAAFEAMEDCITFVAKLETIAASIDPGTGNRTGGGIFGAPSLGETWRNLARSEGNDEAQLARLREKLNALGLLPAAVVAGANQSWRGGTRAMLESLDPKSAEASIPTKLPGLREAAVLKEVRQRFQQFWSQFDDNVAHYYRGTFDQVYAEKMEER